MRLWQRRLVQQILLHILKSLHGILPIHAPRLRASSPHPRMNKVRLIPIPHQPSHRLRLVKHRRRVVGKVDPAGRFWPGTMDMQCEQASGSLYRFDTYLVAFRPGSHWSYFPSVSEILVTVGLVSGELLAFILIVKLFPILTLEKRHVAYHH